MTRLSALLALSLVASAAMAQSIPTPEEFLGYPLGRQFTPYEQILDYFNELAAKSELVDVRTFGYTYEGRPLVLVSITSAENRRRLEAIRNNAVSLGQAETVDFSMPALAWLAFGVHGNESSSAEAAMLVASALLRDPSSAKLLENLVVLIDPLQNPDGRERYIRWYQRHRGTVPNANPDAFEHHEPWPGGRFNHYLIDMNRDWTWMSQRETAARVAEYQRWYPQVVVDFHEMSPQSSYFFPPTAKPIHVNFPREMEKWFDLFGRANAEAFSSRGWPFFVAERFDFFYPGYGDAWPSLHGAIGMTYEMAGGGRAGLTVEREDGAMLTLADRIERHFVTAMTTLRTAAANGEALLRYTHAALRSSVETGRHTYLIVPGSPEFTTLVETLRRQGVRVAMLAGPLTLRAERIDRALTESRSFPAGTAVITTRQPLGRLVQTLLERSADIPKAFLEEQRAKTEADEPDDFYDLTSWSMPLAMNVEAYVTTSSVGPVVPWAAPAPRPFAPASFAYLVSAGETNLYRLVGKLLKDEIRFSVADAPLNFGEQTYPRGSIVILKANNDSELDSTLGPLAAETGVSVVPIQSGWLGATTFGSEKLRFVKEPKIALVGGPGTAPTSFGMLWHTLDVDTPIPHTVIGVDTFRNADLTRYNVIVFPDGDYAERLGKKGVEMLQGWVRNGGTVVAIAGGGSFLREKDVEISKLKPWEPPKKDDQKERPIDERYRQPEVPGSAFRTTMNDRSYLTLSIPRPPVVLIEGSRAFLPVSHRIDNVVTIQKDDPLVSGVAWPESLDRIRGAAFVVSEPYGKGNVITFAGEPHFRLFWRGTLPLLLNAVVYSPSFPR